MSRDDVRSRVAERILAAQGPIPTSTVGRPARWAAGMVNAGAKSLGRTVRRTLGRDASDVEAETAVAESLGQLKGPVMKLGQLFGYVDIGLPDALREALSTLQTTAQPLDMTWIRRVLD